MDINVLFVDDEPMNLKSLKRKMRFEKFICYWANSGENALEILWDNDISIVVTDLRMPEMDGIELSKKIAKLYPNISTIVLTAYHQISTILAAINNGQIKRYLTKPIKVDSELIPAIKSEAEHYILKIERERLLKELKEKNEILNEKINKVNEINKANEILKIKRSEQIVDLAEYFQNFLDEIIMGASIVDNFTKEEIFDYLDDLLEKSKLSKKRIITIKKNILNKIKND